MPIPYIITHNKNKREAKTIEVAINTDFEIIYTTHQKCVNIQISTTPQKRNIIVGVTSIHIKP